MRILHTRIRVRDLERSVAFYRDVLGLEETARRDSPVGNKLVYVTDPASGHEIELCYQPKSGPFTFPEDIFHVAFEVSDLVAFGEALKKRGIPFTDGPHVSATGAMLAFIDDPDGYEIELMQRAKA